MAHRIIVDPKTGRMSTANVAPPDTGALEKLRREVRDHITGNGPAWHTDPHAAPIPVGEVIAECDHTWLFGICVTCGKQAGVDDYDA